MKDKKKCEQNTNKQHCCHNENCDCDINEECNCGENCECENDISAEALGYLELAQRVQADFENYKRRNAEISKTSFNNGVYSLTEKLLPVLDSFKQAKQTVKDENALQGLEIIHNQLLSALSSFGITKIECVGQEFDPHLHNAVLTDCNPEIADDIIVEELQEGFRSENKIIRHSVVKVNKI